MGENEKQNSNQEDIYSRLYSLIQIIQIKSKQLLSRIQAFFSNHRVFLLDMLIFVVLFGLSIWFRYWLHGWFEQRIGRIFHLTVSNDNPSKYWGRIIGASEKTKLQWEGYFDWTYYYGPYISNFLDGWNPYSGHRKPNDPLNGYVYGPFYIYFVSIPAWLFGVGALESAVWSNVVFDSLNVGMVYLIARVTSSRKVSLFAASLYFFSPVVLFYSIVRVLNMPQVTFFVLLFIYLLLKNHDDSALLTLIIAILTKQIALFLIGPAVVYWYRKYGPLKGTSFPLLALIYSIIGSYPWIAITYRSYMLRLLAPGRGKASPEIPDGGVAVTLADSFYYLGLTNFSEFVLVALNSFSYMGLMLIVSAITGWLIFFSYSEIVEKPRQHIRVYLFFLLGIHATLARGIYKYYDPLFIPLIILALIMSEQQPLSSNKGITNTIAKDKPPSTPSFNNASSLKQRALSIVKRQSQHKFKQIKEDISEWLGETIRLFIGLMIFFIMNERILDIPRELHPLLIFTYAGFVLFLLGIQIWISSVQFIKDKWVLLNIKGFRRFLASLPW